MERAEGRPGAVQYVHVQLQGGAPWGFTLRGGLEHGEPLIVSKVEDGGKAALSRKLQPGDELVNISGTPLYGSRQEALILIKGSYRTLKMIVRRRNVPVLRPHSWHMAKFSELRPDAAAMHCPADAFSLSWPSGCDVSTDKSSSIGSMESLDQPGQAYYEGNPSPVDQGLYHNKRDSAYSSFSASSNTSDCALSLRPEETSSTDSILQGLAPCKHPDGRYLQTGADGAESPGSRRAGRHAEPCPPDGGPAGSWRVPVPPQPPVRRDSLRAAPASGAERRRASVPADSLQSKCRWISDTFLCQRDKDVEGSCGQMPGAYPGHTKDRLSSDQYYMLSSHPERCLASAEQLLEESVEHVRGDRPYKDSSGHQPPDAGPEMASDNPLLSPLDCHAPHRHSAPEQLLASQLRSLHVAAGSSGPASPAHDGHRWTVSPLHSEHRLEGSRAQGAGGTGAAEAPGGCAADPPRCQGVYHREPPCRCCPEPQRACGPGGEPAAGSLSPARSVETLVEEGKEGRAAGRRAGAPHHRSAQMRRRSDRFATNLRNEIQRRKAQLQKSRGSGALLRGEEPVEETDEPAEPGCAEGPRAAPGRLSPAPSDDGGRPACAGDGDPPAPEPMPVSQGPPSPERERRRAAGRGRWRWSPERKLQPQRSPSPREPEGYDKGQEAPESPLRAGEEVVLLPFADRRKFFEESSRPVPARHVKPSTYRPKAGEPNAFQPVGAERRDSRRLSVDQPYGPPSPARPGSAGPYAECCREQPAYYKPLARHGEFEYLRAFPYACGGPGPVLREPCRYCSGDLCLSLLPRGHGYRCHPSSWARCSDCYCPASHPVREESEAWSPRKALPPEFPLDEWEPPAINRKTSQSVSELSHYKLGFPRFGPFRPCFENADQEWPPCYRATSTHDLSWDGDRPARSPESPPDPLHRPLRGRAFSESHLNLQPPSPQGRDRRDLPRAKLEPACPPKKKGPPPPRPPPPNWEKYRPRRTSHHQLYPPDSSGHGSAFSAAPEQPRLLSRSIAEVVRERSQSLPAEQAGRPRGPGALPADVARAWPLPERPSTRPCGPSSLRRTPEPDAGAANACRPDEAEEERTKARHPWEKEEQPQRVSRSQDRGWASPCSVAPEEPEASPEALEVASCRASRPQPRRMNSEELLWDVAGRDRSLARILTPPASLVTASELMGELFAVGDRQAWKDRFQQDWRLEAVAQERLEFKPISPPPAGTASPTTYSAYYNTSAGKAELLNKMKDLPEVAEGSLEDDEVDHELAEKKMQLIESLSRKLSVLQEAQRGLQEDISANGVLGEDVAARLQALCTPGEFDKYRLFVGDLDKVVNLLLSLSGRLARVENALNSLGPHTSAEDKLALREKKRQLAAQLEDAKELKEHVGRREKAVGAMVARYLRDEHLQDYQHFVKMKSALITEQRELEEKIKLGQEQLRCLRESLGQAHKGC
ncbi:protein Shroom4 isoform X2 [Struthio camelus]|uniref:protein Shroom4 isoform X2 n=1 Tax=Struthio camelus TaxID=8801 RepID=UPI003604184F